MKKNENKKNKEFDDCQTVEILMIGTLKSF